MWRIYPCADGCVGELFVILFSCLKGPVAIVDILQHGDEHRKLRGSEAAGAREGETEGGMVIKKAASARLFAPLVLS